jgi:hypothetical protein
MMTKRHRIGLQKLTVADSVKKLFAYLELILLLFSRKIDICYETVSGKGKDKAIPIQTWEALRVPAG